MRKMNFKRCSRSKKKMDEILEYLHVTLGDINYDQEDILFSIYKKRNEFFIDIPVVFNDIFRVSASEFIKATSTLFSSMSSMSKEDKLFLFRLLETYHCNLTSRVTDEMDYFYKCLLFFMLHKFLMITVAREMNCYDDIVKEKILSLPPFFQELEGEKDMICVVKTMIVHTINDEQNRHSLPEGKVMA
jgi:hypothetical protein